MVNECLKFENNYSKNHITVSIPQNTPPNCTYPSFLSVSEAVLEVLYCEYKL